MCYVLCAYEIITISFSQKYECEKYWIYYNYYYFPLGRVVSSKTFRRYVAPDMQNINHLHAFNCFIEFMSVIDGEFYSVRGLHVPAKRVSDPGIKFSRYHAMNYKTINSVEMIYILHVRGHVPRRSLQRR